MGVEMNANLIGTNLGPYRIVEQIGRGGMATVYKAYEPALDRYVAIKVLPQYFAHDPSFSARFDREAKAVARLNHPNILPIYSFGQEGGLSYIAMRYVGEGTLKDRLGPPLDLETALDILRQVGQALDYAHCQGIIHRDVKPTNVLVAEGHSQAPGGGNWVLLADFGLARMVESASQLTKSGVGVGTPAYMSPEQGQGTPVDARSDLYSLGVVLYEMVTGRVPYEAETPMAVVLKHITAPLPMPRSLNPTLSEAAERVILKAMAKNPDDRFQTAQEMVEALERALEETTVLGWPSEETQAEPVPPVETVTPAETLPVEAVSVREQPAEALPVQAPDVEAPPVEALPVEAPVTEALPEERPARVPFVKRLPLWAWGAIGLFVVLVAVGGALVATGGWERLVARDRTTPTATSEPISRATSTSRPATPAPEPERWVAVGTCEGAVPWQICIHDHESGEAIQLTHDLDFGEQGVFAWSPDGEQIVFNAGSGLNADGGYDHKLYVINADGSGLRQITEGETNDLDPSWSPDGQWIAFHHGCGLRIIHPDGSGARDLLQGTDELCVGGTAWSPDGQRIVFADWHARDDVHEIWIVGRDGSDPHAVHAFEQALEWFVPAWSPDGDRLACIYGGEGWTAGFTIGPEGGGEPERVAEDRLPWHWFPNHRLWEGEWAGIEPAPPAGPERWVSAEGCEGEMHVQICIHDHENGEVIQLTDDLDFDGIGRPAWSPDGEQIVFNAGWEDDVSGWHDSKIYAINADGTGLRQITEGDFSDADPSWSPDGEWIALHRNCGLWIVRPDGSDAHELLPGSDDFCAFQTSWSPDSQDIAFINSPPEKNVHELWIVDRNGRDPHVVYTLDTATVWADAAWSRDHDQLVFIYEAENETEGFVIDASGGEPEWLAHDQLPWHWLPYYWPWQDMWANMEPPPHAGPGRSVYVEWCDGVVPWQICIRDEESGEAIQVTDDLDFGECGAFAWSPDGEQIVFNAGVGPDADGGYDHKLYVVNADGSGLHRITEGDENDLDPSWSPDGEWIAFNHGCGLRIVHPDGSGARDLLEGTDELCVGGTSWSPDGERIAFVDWHNEDDIQGIWVIGRDGSDPHVVHAFERAVEWIVPAWNPDGGQLACIYGGETWAEGLVLDPEGGEPEPLGEDRLPWHWLPHYAPQWSGGDLPSGSGPMPEDPWGLIVIPPGEPIGIGVVADFSGPNSELGPLYENAVRMAVDDRGQIAGFPVGVAVADGGCAEEMGVAAARVMVGDPAVAGVVGHSCSSSCGSALPIYEEAHYVTISASCTGTDLSAPGYAVFNRVVMRDDQGGDVRNREIVATDPYRDFAARYEERYGQPLESEGLGFVAAYAYDAAGTLLSAISEVAVVDGSGALIVGRQSLAEAVRGISGYSGVTGVIRFDERGDRLP
jgi:Tol biopolymer transport system component